MEHPLGRLDVGCNDPLALELEPGKLRTYVQSFAAGRQPIPWNAAEIDDILTFAPLFEATKLVYLLLKLGRLDAFKQGSGKTICLQAHNSMFTFALTRSSVWNQLEEKRIFDDHVPIGKLIVADIDEADLSVLMGLQFALYDAVIMELFTFEAHEGSIVSLSYHMILSLAALPSFSFCSQRLGQQHTHLVDNVSEDLTSFIWMNFGSMLFDEESIGDTARVLSLIHI